jgi:hypothetical protein
MELDRRSLLAGAAATLLIGAESQAEEAAAAVVLREARAAADDGKRLMLVFHASWCVWCGRMDAMLTDPDAASRLAPHFRILHLRAQERADVERAKQLDGADEVYLRYARPGAGLPFVAILDTAAEPVATSFLGGDGDNFGFPVKDFELDGFDAMLATAAPAMSGEDRAALREACVRVMAA